MNHSVSAVRLSVAVPCVRLGDGAPALHTDRGHSLSSLDSATGGGRVAPYLLRYAQSVKRWSDNRRSLRQSINGNQKKTTQSGGLFLAPPVGLEPTTCGLTVIGRNSPLIFLRPLSQISPVIMDLFKVMD